MKLYPSKSIARLLLKRMPVDYFTALMCSAVCISMVYFSSSAAAEERSKALHIQIPSIPEDAPKADMVDNNLPVYLLDAQIPTGDELKQSAAGAAPISNGQLVVGSTAAPETPKPKTLKISPQESSSRTRTKPQLMVGDRRAARKPIAGNPTLTAHEIPAQPTPATAVSEPVAASVATPLAAPQTLAEAAPFVTATQTKPFLNLFPMNQPDMVAMRNGQEASPNSQPIQNAQPVARSLQITVPTQEPPERITQAASSRKAIDPYANSNNTLSLPGEQNVAAATPSTTSIATASAASQLPEPTHYLDAAKPIATTAPAQSPVIDANTRAAQDLNEATASLAESLQKINPFETDMPSLLAWAEQKNSQAAMQNSVAPSAAPAQANAMASPASTQHVSAIAAPAPAPALQTEMEMAAAQMAAITPAAGSSPASTTGATQKSPPVRRGIVIEEVNGTPPATAIAPVPDTKLASIDPEAKPIAPSSAAPASALPSLIGEPSAAPSAPAPFVAQAATPLPSQDTAELPKSSERLLKKIPSKLDAPKKSSKQRIDIEHENINPSVFSELDKGETVASHEAMGLKIEVKRQAFNANSELERAYDALAAGNTDIAMESYKRILSNDPNNIQALFGAGAILHRAGDLDGAKSYYSRVLARDPDHRDTLNNFLSLVADEAPEEALSKLKNLEGRNPDFSPIPAQISYIYQKLGNIPLAGQYMVKALSLAPNNLTYQYNLAILLDKQGAKQEAASYYQRLVEAHLKGASIPGNIDSIQERLTFIRSNSK